MTQPPRPPRAKTGQAVALLVAGLVGVALAWTAGPMQSGSSAKNNLLPEQQGEHPLQAGQGAENCFTVHPDQQLDYQFQASGNVYFDVHYHIGQEVGYSTRLPEAQTGQGSVRPPQKDIYCLYWENRGASEVRVTYSGILASQDPNQVRTELRLRYQADTQSIGAFDLSDQERFTLKVGHPVLNFSLNNEASLLAVLVSDVPDPLRVYELPSGTLRYALPLDQTPRFLVFSGDDRFLALGDEHMQQVTRVDLEMAQEERLLLPAAPQALSPDKDPQFFLARLEGEVIKVGFDPLEVTERRAKIELAFGEETILADPEEVCFAHGVPHPLYTPIPEAMSPQGLPASVLLAAQPL